MPIRPRTRLVIVDLDNCIYDICMLGDDAVATLLAAIRNAGLSPEKEEAACQAIWNLVPHTLIDKFKLSKEAAQAVELGYRLCRVPAGMKLHTYGDDEYLWSTPCPKILVTSGYRMFQQSKIDALGIADKFEEIIIDAMDDLTKWQGHKHVIFERLMLTRGLDPSEILVVGDSASSELAAGHALGMRTVQTLRPRVERWDSADHHITSFSELGALL